MLFLTNTESRRKEKIVPPKSKKFLLYACGPTVYGPAHIGNLRTYVAEDLLRRTLKFFGVDLIHCMNITDVDDKTIRGAIASGKTLQEYTEPYTQMFLADLKALNIERPDHLPKATDFIPQMIDLIQKLLDQGIAYQSEDGSVFFRLSEFPQYGRLSHLPMDQLQAGASQRVASDEYDKDHITDFVLWKAYDPKRDGDHFWQSPFGKGRPGWHIECSAMAMATLGQTIDLHCGGVDNIFPHHENEIAQSEAVTHQCFAKHWYHVNHLIVDGKKMAKSLGNFYCLKDLLEKGYTGREVRYLLLSVHYQMSLNFTLDGLKAARSALERIDHFTHRLDNADGKEAPERAVLQDSAAKAFTDALADDLNIAKALATLFDLIRDINTLIDRKALSQEGAQSIRELLKNWDRVLAVIDWKSKNSIPTEVETLFHDREKARQEKNWAEADRLRDLILARGYAIEDGPKGSFLVFRSHEREK